MTVAYRWMCQPTIGQHTDQHTDQHSIARHNSQLTDVGQEIKQESAGMAKFRVSQFFDQVSAHSVD